MSKNFKNVVDLENSFLVGDTPSPTGKIINGKHEWIERPDFDVEYRYLLTPEQHEAVMDDYGAMDVIDWEKAEGCSND